MEEWFDNLTSEALDSSYLGKIPEFYVVTRLAKWLFAYFSKLNYISATKAQVHNQNLKNQLNDYFRRQQKSIQKEILNEVDKNIESGTMAAPIPPDYIPAPLKTTEEICKNKTEIDETFLKTSLEIANEEIKANKQIEAEKTKKILEDIVTPAPGLVVQDKFIPDNLPPSLQTTNNPIVLTDKEKQMPLITIVDNDKYKTKEAPLPTYIEGPSLLLGPNPRIINQNDFDDFIPTMKIIDPSYHPFIPPKVEVILPPDNFVIPKNKEDPENIFIDDNFDEIEIPKFEIPKIKIEPVEDIDQPKIQLPKIEPDGGRMTEIPPTQLETAVILKCLDDDKIIINDTDDEIEKAVIDSNDNRNVGSDVDTVDYNMSDTETVDYNRPDQLNQNVW